MLDQLVFIDQRCDEFEQEWKVGDGQRPDLATYLRDCPAGIEEKLFESLLSVDLWWRMKQGESPSRLEYEGLIVGQDEWLDKIFNEQDESFARKISQLGSMQSLGLQIDRPSNDFASPWPEVHLRVRDTSNSEQFRYQILSVIGRGQFGVLFLAFDKVLHRNVAIKLLSAEVVLHIGSVERCLHEARALANLRHPHIVPVYDAGSTEDGIVFIVFHYLAGEDLSSVVSKRRYTVEGSVELVCTLADALSEAHRCGIIHRDVKPANVMIDKATGQAFLIDFGLARVTDQAGHDSGIFGTPAYMSPEQVSQGHASTLSDQYSLAAILYELVTGRVPFYGPSVRATMDAIVRHELVSMRSLNSAVPANLDAACLRALSQNPDDRFDTIADFAQALRTCLGEDVSRNSQVANRRLVLGATFAGLTGLVVSSVYNRFRSSSMDDKSVVGKGSSTAGRVNEIGHCTLLVNRQGGAFYPVETMWPLRSGDSVRFDVVLNEPAYVKIIWVSGSGESVQIYPTQEMLLAGESLPVQLVESPSQVDAGWPLQGAAGLESAWVLVSKVAAIATDDNDLTIPPRQFGEESFFRKLTFSVNEGVSIDFAEPGYGTRSLGQQSVESTDLLRRYLEKLKDDFDTVWVYDLPYRGE
ncbi:serine/threonine-protein kinase [Rubripirellula sp.]|nr:serine/threonine-protein kinase [Rubripirellula sp.]